jgi:hypothetical protein
MNALAIGFGRRPRGVERPEGLATFRGLKTIVKPAAKYSWLSDS